MKEKVWNIPQPPVIPPELLRAGCTPLLAAVLAARGILTEPEARAYLGTAAPSPAQPPAPIPGTEATVARLTLARDRGETVAVYGDYDVDGITATCLLADCLTRFGINTLTYIPDRLEEGYGVNAGAIRRLKALGAALIVTVDCGITAVEETGYARSLGVDMIITDHHECQAELPDAVAVVDPKRPDLPGPDRDLAGVGVAFKLACALTGDDRAALERYADLVAVGTIADVMPLTGENRQIVKLGLEKIRSAPRPGLAALVELSGLNLARLNANSVGYTLAPRINAAGRLGQVGEAAALVMESDPDRAMAQAQALCDMNRQRQALEAEIWEQAAGMLAGFPPGRPIVLAREGWHQGVIGIVASRLSEAYQVPAVMISLDGDRGKGSCRSWGGFNLFGALAACEGWLDSFGGHALAAGLNIRRDKVDGFRQALWDYYAAHPPLGEESLDPDVLVTDPALLSMECVASLEAMEPCGNGNPRPVLCMTDALLTMVTPIGGGRHVRLQLEKYGQRYDCVWFSKTAAELSALPGDRVDAVFFPQVSEYRGRRNVQLMMSGLRRTDLEALCGGILAGSESGDHRLDRRQLAGLWRNLSAKCPCRVRLSRLGGLDERLHPAQIALGLRVLQELGLAQIALRDREAQILLVAWEDKTQLDNSPTWRRLNG